MDNICEQNVQKMRTKGDIAKVAAILIGFALLSSAIVYFSLITGLIIFIMGAIGLMALAVWLTGNVEIEYEYIITNNEMDIDKIIGRRKRRRMITIDLSNATEFSEYPPESEAKHDVTVYASSGLAQDAHYLLTEHSDYGTVMVIFNPNEKIREAMTQEFPQALRSKMKHNVK